MERFPRLTGAFLTLPFTAGPPARGVLLGGPPGGLTSASDLTSDCCCAAPAALFPNMKASRGSISSSSSAAKGFPLCCL